MRKMKFVGLFVLLAVVLLGATGCLNKTPEKIIKKMMMNMADVETANMDLVAMLDGQFPQISELEGGEVGDSKVSIKLNGDFDLESEENAKYHLAAEISNQADDSSMTIAGELLSKEGVMYVKLAETPEIPMIDLDSLKGTWYQFDMNTLNPTEVKREESEMSRSQMRKMKKLISKTEFFKVVKDHGSESVNGVMAYHYEVKVNQEELINFFREANKIVEGRDLSDIEEQEMSANLQKLSDINGEVWIGEDDYLLYRTKLAGASETDESGAVDYDITLNLKDFGKSVDINKPADVREFDMMSMFMPDMAEFDNFDPQLDSINNEDIMMQFEGMDGVDMDELEKQLEEMQIQFNQ